MTDPIPYAIPAPGSKEISQLTVLSVLHYVWGGLTKLISCVFIIHIVLGILMINGNGVFNVQVPAGSTPPAFPNGPPPAMGYLFAFGGGCAVLMGWTFGIFTIISGRRIAQHRSRVFSIVIAAINCISFPFGTALGVFTIIVLAKDSVKMLYGELQ
jgi:hypothetical protein